MGSYVLKGCVCATILLLNLPGCARDLSVQLPARLETVDVDRQPSQIARGLRPQTVLVSCFGSQTVCEISLKQNIVTKKLKVLKGPRSLVRDQARQAVYCLHTQENALAILGGSPLRVRRKLGTGSINLASARLRPGTNELWVCDGVSAVSILLVPQMQLKRKIQLGRYPQAIAFANDGQTAWITLKGENAVAVLDIQSGEVVRRIPVGIYPQDILITGQTAYVANSGSHDISLLDVKKREERIRIPVRKMPQFLARHKQTLWVSCAKSFRLVAIDLKTEEVIGTVKTGFYPGDIEVLPDGRLAVTAPQKNKLALIEVGSIKPQ